MTAIDAQLAELLQLFGDVAAVDPLSGLSLAIGGLITLVYAVVGGWLGLGALVDFFTRRTGN